MINKYTVTHSYLFHLFSDFCHITHSAIAKRHGKLLRSIVHRSDTGPFCSSAHHGIFHFHFYIFAFGSPNLFFQKFCGKRFGKDDSFCFHISFLI